MATPNISASNDATYPDDPTRADIKQHQIDTDKMAAVVNQFDMVPPPSVVPAGQLWLPVWNGSQWIYRQAIGADIADKVLVQNAVSSASGATWQLGWSAPGFGTGATYKVMNLNGNVTFSCPTDGPTGILLAQTIEVVQDATGNRTVLFQGITWANKTAPTPSTAPGSVDMYMLTTRDGGVTVRGYDLGRNWG
jgi:hypothetical protein